MDVDSFFVFSFSFLAILGLLVLLYILIPLITRKRNNKRRKTKLYKKIESLEKIKKKQIDNQINYLKVDNYKLKINLKEDLYNISKNNSKENLKLFFINFEKLYPDFKNKILNKSPNLTANELKLAAFLKLNVSSKEIANILNITSESVNKARYRLRKKLNLDTKEDLSTYILNL